MMVTTYRHDYLPPHTKRYEIFKDKKPAEQQIAPCQCSEEQKIDAPKVMQQKQCNVEWTGVAPMGRLIDPRIIPTQLSDEQLDAMLNNESGSDCFKEQPNRFLKILRTTYPDLYERLKEMPDNELSRRLDRDRMYTTYQVDFCGINEYPEGIYKSLKVEDETSKLNASKLLERKEPCAEIRATVMENLAKDKGGDVPAKRDLCQKTYKPFKISFADSSRFINSGNNSHWRNNAFTKRVKFSEYMDTINKIGCVIMKNKIHDHQKCTENSCRHQLIHACANLK